MFLFSQVLFDWTKRKDPKEKERRNQITLLLPQSTVFARENLMFQFREKNNSGVGQRGFFGMAILDAKHEPNVGVLWRSAFVFGASFMATVGEKRYKTNRADTTQSHRHLPLFHFSDVNDLRSHLPKGCQLIGVELCDEASDLQKFVHPERALYLLGSEDHGIPYHVLSLLDRVIKINTSLNVSLNVGVAGSIILYDRILKQERT